MQRSTAVRLGAIIFIVLGAIAVSTSTYVAAQTKTQTLRFASFVGPTSFLNAGIFEPWFKQIEEASDGTLKIHFLTGSSAAKPSEVFDAVKTGLVDIGWSVTAYNPGRFKSSGVVELPLIADTAHQASVGYASLYAKGMLDGFGDVKVIGLATSDVLRLHHVGDVKSIADFKGAKMRAAGPVISSVLEQIGANPVGMPITSVAESLAKKVINGAAADWYSLKGFKLIGVTKSHVDVALGAAAIYVVINKRKYDQLSDKAKAALDKYSVTEFAIFWGKALTKESNKVKENLNQLKGHKIISPTTADLAQWKKIATQQSAAWSKKMKNGSAILEAYRQGVFSAK